MVSKKEQDYFIGLGEKLGRRNALIKIKRIITLLTKDISENSDKSYTTNEKERILDILSEIECDIKKLGEKDG